MQVNKGVGGARFESLRLYDGEMDYIVDFSWDDAHANGAGGVWTEPQEIPQGQKIMGLKVDIFHIKRIRSLSFILSPQI